MGLDKSALRRFSESNPEGDFPELWRGTDRGLLRSIWVLQTTSEVFTRIDPDNSLERLTECGVGLVTDQSSDFWELFVTPFK